MLQRGITLAVLTILLTTIIGWMVAERVRHTRNLRATNTRILVNGIRGKSSITRLIAGALRADPTRTVVAKTTGTAARLIYPGGRETPIHRPQAIVNVIEQVGVVGRARRLGADTLVIECMAVDPDLQRLNLHVLTRPHIAVLSNVRADHLEEMGGPDRSLDQVGRSLAAGSMLPGSVCVTAESDRWGLLAAEADRLGARLVYADPQSVTDAEMAHFTWITFKENVALALEVARMCGVPRQTALAGMYAADPDPGVLRVDACRYQGKTFAVVNLFAANDPTSTLANVNLLRERGKIGGQTSVVINCRPDRQHRNGQMGALCADLNPRWIVLVGEPTRSAAEHVPDHLRDRIVDLGGQAGGDDLLEAIVGRLSDGGHTLLLIGNIHGVGEHLLNLFAGCAADLVPDDVDAELRAMTDTAILDMGAVDTVVLPRIREDSHAGR